MLISLASRFTCRVLGGFYREHDVKTAGACRMLLMGNECEADLLVYSKMNVS